MYPDWREDEGEPPAGNEGGEGQGCEARRCIVDDDLACPPSRYDCTRPCPYVGWEKRMTHLPQAGSISGSGSDRE